MKILLIAALAACSVFACGPGYTAIRGQMFNPDGSIWAGTVSYPVMHNPTTQVIIGGKYPQMKDLRVNAFGLNLCMISGTVYPVTLRQDGVPGAIEAVWTMPEDGGPYTVAQIMKLK